MGRLLGALATLLLLLGAAGTASANHNGAQGLVLYENSASQGDTIIRCSGTINEGHCAHTGDLGNVTHTQAGYCDAQPDNSWDNCANEIQYRVPDGQCLVLYREAWYSSVIVTLWDTDGIWRFYDIPDNVLTSYRIGVEVNGGTGPHCYFPS